MSPREVEGKHAHEHDALVDELYRRYPPITLPPEYAHFTEENLLRLLIRLARYKFVARMIRPEDRVLEVGCGSGLGTVFLGQHCVHVKGIDINERELAEARAINRRENVDFVLEDVFEMRSDDVYDVVVALDVIEHLNLDDGRALTAAMADRLTPSGMLALGTPSVYSYEYQSDLSKAAHITLYDMEELDDLAREFCGRTVCFSMNDEVVHTGFSKLAWYYFVLGFVPGLTSNTKG